MSSGKKVDFRSTDPWAVPYVEKMIKLLPPDYPDPAYTIDIACLGGQNYRVIEVNSLCCAGLYQLDKKLIVEAMNELAIKKYNDFWEGSE